MKRSSIIQIACLYFALLLLILPACSSSQPTARGKAKPSDASKAAALQTLAQALTPATNATLATSIDIDWPAGVLPWDRFTLPVISPNGLHAAVQLGKTPPIQVLCGNDNTNIDTTTIELHMLDPMQGRRISPLIIGRSGLILSMYANDSEVLVESPNGEQGRWIGKIDWATGNFQWIVSDDAINAFPTMNSRAEFAWSRRLQDENRFHLVIKTHRGERIIDDGESDWVMPTFVGTDRLRAYRIKDDGLSLVEFDLLASNPMQTAMTFEIVEKGATRALAWQIASTNPKRVGSTSHAFYHPHRQRMVIWQPHRTTELIPLARRSVAAAPVGDGTWLVATDKRIIRQSIDEDDGIHLRNHLAIPIATTSRQWTHFLLIPDGNRLQVRAINLSE